MRLDWRSKRTGGLIFRIRKCSIKIEMCPQEKCHLDIFSSLDINQCYRNEVTCFQFLSTLLSFSPSIFAHTISSAIPQSTSISTWLTPAHPLKPNRDIVSVKPPNIPKTESDTPSSVIPDIKCYILYVLNTNHIKLWETVRRRENNMSFGVKDKKLHPNSSITNSVSLSKLPNLPDVSPFIKWGQ